MMLQLIGKLFCGESFFMAKTQVLRMISEMVQLDAVNAVWYLGLIGLGRIRVPCEGAESRAFEVDRPMSDFEWS